MNQQDVKKLVRASRLLSRNISSLVELAFVVILLYGQTVRRIAIIRKQIKKRKVVDENERLNNNK